MPPSTRSTAQSSTTGTTPQIRDSGPPFDDADADIILRSVDNVDFRVIRAILSRASQGFRDMFAAQPSPSSYNNSEDSDPNDFKDGIPVIRLEEDAATLYALLRLIYPLDNPSFKNHIGLLQSVMRAVDKYVVDSMPRTIETILKSFVEKYPHLVYAMACRYDRPRIADQAAVETLRQPIMLSDGPLSDMDLLQISSVQFRKLLQYHHRCTEAATSLLHAWSPGVAPRDPAFYPCSQLPNNPPPGPLCTCQRLRVPSAAPEQIGWDSFDVPFWISEFLRYCELKVNTRPHWMNLDRHPVHLSREGVANHDDLLVTAIHHARRCARCELKVHEELPAFRRRLLIALKERVELVSDHDFVSYSLPQTRPYILIPRYLCHTARRVRPGKDAHQELVPHLPS